MLIELCYYCNHLFCYGLQFMKKTYWCKSALLTDGWAKSVTIEVDNDGNISAIKIDQQPESFVKLDAVIPGVPNLHSHAHQRAMSGLGEKAGANKEAMNKVGSTALNGVEGPFEQMKPIYDLLGVVLGPLGLKLDYERITATRPKIAEMLR